MPVSAGELNDVIFQAMEEEAARSMKNLHIDVFDPPYFISYQVRQQDHAEVSASFGALLDSKSGTQRSLFVDIRIGDPSFDSSTPGSHQFQVEQLVPLDDDLMSLKRALWYETDLRYKQGIMNYLKKKGRFISGVEEHKLPDFASGNDPVVHLEPVAELTVPMKEWEGLAREISGYFKSAPEIEKSRVTFQADRGVRHHFDTDGNRIRDVSLNYSVLIEAWTKSESGNMIHDQDILMFTEMDRFPPSGVLAEKVKRLIESVNRLRTAEKMDPYVGPALFSPDAAAVLFHEAAGHRLEADRLRDANDGKTFLRKVGKLILPSFLTLVDNPGIKQFHEQNLVGYYQFDDEGQMAREVVLVENGVLKNFLLSRTPVLGFNRTNGHARSDGHRLPMSRMANFIVRSDRRLAPAELKRQLIEQVLQQKKPFGLYVKKIAEGETQTETGDFQVFKGKPLYLYKVFPDGREQLVRGVEFVGTPISMLAKIAATGDDEAVINGFCGAESGRLPVATVTPSVLLTEVELQASHEQKLRPPILPPPPG